MALKPTRTVADEVVDYRFVDATVVTNHGGTVQRGGVAAYSDATGSGVVIDQAENKVSYVAEPSGAIPVGLLIHDVVNLDLTRTNENKHKMEVQVGRKVPLYKICRVTTDRVYPGHSPAAGTKAYLGHSGYIAASDVATDHVDSTGASRVVGRWAGVKDQDGYATIDIKLPNTNV